MCANKEKLESLIGKWLVPICHSLRFLCDLSEKCFCVLPDLMAASGVNHAIARGMQQPRLRLLRDAVPRPPLQCCSDGVLECVLRPGHIARPRSDVGDQPSI